MYGLNEIPVCHANITLSQQMNHKQHLIKPFPFHAMGQYLIFKLIYIVGTTQVAIASVYDLNAYSRLCGENQDTDKYKFTGKTTTTEYAFARKKKYIGNWPAHTAIQPVWHQIRWSDAWSLCYHGPCGQTLDNPHSGTREEWR